MRQSVPLAPLTTLGIGGPAAFFETVDSEDALCRGLNWAREQGLPWLVLGGGSNVLISDDGFPGLVLHMALRGLSSTQSSRAVLLTAAAGEEWDSLVAFCVERNWAGLECLSGIPGRVGATPIQNVGAYGQEVKECVQRVRAYDSHDGRWVEFDAAECRFRYRDSRFKSDEAGRYVVTAVTYGLKANGAPTIHYADLQRVLSQRGFSAPTLAQVREVVLTVRRGKSMVVDAADPNSRSVGSFFVNPVVSTAQWERVVEGARRHALLEEGSLPPHYAAAADMLKLSAAWLIERAGFPGGYRRGTVGLSDNHTLALVNRGGATAAQVLALMAELQEGVESRFGVRLQPEPVFVNLAV